MVKRGPILNKTTSRPPSIGSRPSGGSFDGPSLALFIFMGALLLFGQWNDYNQSQRLDRLEKDNALQQLMITELGDKVHGLEIGGRGKP